MHIRVDFYSKRLFRGKEKRQERWFFEALPGSFVVVETDVVELVGGAVVVEVVDVVDEVVVITVVVVEAVEVVSYSVVVVDVDCVDVVVDVVEASVVVDDVVEASVVVDDVVDGSVVVVEEEVEYSLVVEVVDVVVDDEYS